MSTTAGRGAEPRPLAAPGQHRTTTPAPANGRPRRFRRVRGCRPALVAALAAALSPSAGEAAQTYLLVVTGLGGEPRYQEAFHRWGTTLIDAAAQRFGIPRDHIWYLAEAPERDSARLARRSTREAVERTLAELAERAEPNATVFIVLIGHGSDIGEPRLNLPGPDLTAAGLARSLDRFPTQRVVVVHTASASGDWLPALSGKQRVVVTATRSGSERYETMFGELFVEAYTGDGADTDKDGRVSLLEAFEFARREVARRYQGEGRLQSEHALLDDDGDGRGSAEPDPQGGDGALAARIFLDPGERAATGATAGTADPELAALYATRDSLEREVAEHRARRDGMDAIGYERELEQLLLELARTTRAIREREGRRPR